MFHVISIILSKKLFFKFSKFPIEENRLSYFASKFPIGGNRLSYFAAKFPIEGISPFVLCSDPMTRDHVTYLNCFNYSLLGLDAKNNINTALCKYLPHFCRIFRKMYRTFAKIDRTFTAFSQKSAALLPHFLPKEASAVPHFSAKFTALK